jgi:serine/threonine-protein kinase
MMADQADRQGQGTRAIYEAAGAASAMVEAQRQWLKTRESRRVSRESTAADLRRQIEELRGQLSRYAEALEEDLSSGREKVAARTREGLKYEKAFGDAFTLLVTHLKGKPECRDLMTELTGPVGEGENGASGGPGPGRPQETPL